MGFQLESCNFSCDDALANPFRTDSILLFGPKEDTGNDDTTWSFLQHCSIIKKCHCEQDLAMNTSFCHNIPLPVRPSPGINYNFVSMMYLAGSGFAVIFYALEKHIFPSILGVNDDQKNDNTTSVESSNAGEIGNDAHNGGDAWKEFAHSLEGIYLIFIPFIPCLLWSFVVRHYWLKETTRYSSKEKKEN